MNWASKRTEIASRNHGRQRELAGRSRPVASAALPPYKLGARVIEVIDAAVSVGFAASISLSRPTAVGRLPAHTNGR